jgi:hypothetical protein
MSASSARHQLGAYFSEQALQQVFPYRHLVLQQ